MTGGNSPGASPCREMHVFVTFIRDAAQSSGQQMTELANGIAQSAAKLTEFVIRTANTQNTVRIYVRSDLRAEDVRRFERKLWLTIRQRVNISLDDCKVAGWVLWRDPDDGDIVFEVLKKPKVW